MFFLQKLTAKQNWSANLAVILMVGQEVSGFGQRQNNSWLSRDDDNDPKRGQIDFAANKKKSIDTGTSQRPKLTLLAVGKLQN